MSTKTAQTAEGAAVIVIDGDLVKVTRTVVEKQVKTSELLQELARLQPVHTGLLPRGCIAFARRTDERGHTVSLYVIERPAGMVTIRYKDGRSSDEQSDENIVEHRLSWPHTLWFVKHNGAAITDLFLTCTKTPVRELSDKILVLPMPNLYDAGNGGVCLGNLVVPDTSNPAQRTENLVETVMGSLWNQDLLPDYSALNLEGLKDWADKSALDPNFGLTLGYTDHRAETLDHLIAKLLGDEP